MAINTEIMPWGTIIEMMPAQRSSFRRKKSYEGIYLGKVKNSQLIKVIAKNRSTVEQWSPRFWRQKI